MRRFALVVVLIALGAVIAAPTCGSEDGQKGAGEPCTRGSECVPDLQCQGGVCREPVEDGATRDGG